MSHSTNPHWGYKRGPIKQPPGPQWDKEPVVIQSCAAGVFPLTYLHPKTSNQTKWWPVQNNSDWRL